MSTALVISLLAVAISLGAAFMAVQAKKAKKSDKRGGSDSSVAASSDASGADCGASDGGGCGGD